MPMRQGWPRRHRTDGQHHIYTNNESASEQALPDRKMEFQASNSIAQLGDRFAGGQADNRPFREVSDWYIRRAGTWWCAVNLVTALACTVIGWDHAQHVVIITWLVFTSLNAALYVLISHNISPWIRPIDVHANSTHIGMACIFGITWGICCIILGPVLPAGNISLLICVGVLVTAAAVPVFAFHRGAYPVFAIMFAPLAAAGLGNSLQLEYVEIFVGLSFIVALVLAAMYATFIRRVIKTLAGFANIGTIEDKASTTDLSSLFEQRIRVLKQLVRKQRSATATLDAIGEAIITTNEADLIDYMNPVAEVLTGIRFHEAQDQGIETVVNITSPSGENLLHGLIERCRAGTNVRRNDDGSILRRRDGVEYEVEYQLSGIRNDRGNIIGTSFLVRDVTTKRNLIKNIAWRSTHDPLTNLINRTEFEERINKLISANMDTDHKRHALCLIDFDRFKLINEAHGIEGGNHLLKSIAVELKQKIRGADTLARIGDDKFGVLLYACPIDKARLIAEGLRHIVEDFQIDWDGVDLSFSVSIGVVDINPAEDDLTDVFNRAEAACEWAKKSSGNRVYTFDKNEQTGQRHGEHTERLREIQSAIQSDRLELYFQPIHPIRDADGRFDACELLLRLRDSAEEDISPRDFLLSAGRYQLIPELDRWAIKATVDAIRMNHPALADMETICVNISGQSINDERFLEFIVDLLDDDVDVDNGRICFDISEIRLISSIERAQFFIATLKELGCRIALDDFGIGTSSFELMKHLQVDYLKINAGFIRNMASNSVDYEIVLALSRIAKTLKIKTIAEGVTTFAAKDSLLGMGVDYVQGLLIDQPRPVRIAEGARH